MSHYTVGVIIPAAQLRNITRFVARQMRLYNENLKVAPYVSYSLEQARQDLDHDLRHFADVLERQDPDFNLEKCREYLAQLRQTTPDQKYAEYVRYHEHFNSRGDPISTYNPASKWDWYKIGGRWDGWFYDRIQRAGSISGNLATAEHLLDRQEFPFALLTPDGRWHDRGSMAWWGVVINGKPVADWHAEATAILTEYPGHSVALIDAHI